MHIQPQAFQETCLYSFKENTFISKFGFAEWLHALSRLHAFPAPPAGAKSQSPASSCFFCGRPGSSSSFRSVRTSGEVCGQNTDHTEREEFSRFSVKSLEAFLLERGWKMESWWSVTENQVDQLAVERLAWALGYGAPGNVLVGEGDQGFAAALTAEVIQDKYGIWLELQEERKKKMQWVSSVSPKWRENHQRAPTVS